MIDEQPSTNKSQLADAVISAATEWYERDYVTREACTASEAQLGSTVRELRDLLGGKAGEDSCIKAGRHVCGPMGG